MDFYRRAALIIFLLLATGIVSVASAQSTPSPASTATSTPLVITRPLYVGVSGSDVSSLQQFLKNQGYFTYPTNTGYYGAATWQAVADF
jgi:peptidoglycan hydrolase-like protein with peptidoglycan-binding domain